MLLAARPVTGEGRAYIWSPQQLESERGRACFGPLRGDGCLRETREDRGRGECCVLRASPAVSCITFTMVVAVHYHLLYGPAFLRANYKLQVLGIYML